MNKAEIFVIFSIRSKSTHPEEISKLLAINYSDSVVRGEYKHKHIDTNNKKKLPRYKHHLWSLSVNQRKSIKLNDYVNAIRRKLEKVSTSRLQKIPDAKLTLLCAIYEPMDVVISISSSNMRFFANLDCEIIFDCYHKR